MDVIPLYPGRGYVDVGGWRYFLQVDGDGVLVSRGLLVQPVAMDALVDLVLELGLAADELLDHPAGWGLAGSDPDDGASPPVRREPQPAAACPRCGEVTPGAYAAQVCSLCGHGWRSAPDDDGDDRPGRAGGGR